MTTRFLRHITLSSGDVRDSYRHEVSDEAVAYCRDLVASVLADPETSHGIRGLPTDEDGIPLYRMSASANARSLWCTILWRDLPLAHIGIATHSRSGASLWRLLTDDLRSPMRLRCPPEPWVAARLEPGIVMCTPQVIMAIADLGRCLGWAWIEMQERAREKTET